ncbi:unnamed protein product, partial [Amoebophrya sp. A25]|eukprot:GSA25T00027882001.1
MFALQKQNYGVAKGIPSLVVCAASLDDVVAISGFTTSLGLAMSTLEGDTAHRRSLEGVSTLEGSREAASVVGASWNGRSEDHRFLISGTSPVVGASWNGR